MTLAHHHYELLAIVTEDLEPFDAIVSMLDVSWSARQAMQTLRELERLGLVASALLVDHSRWRQPEPEDFARAVAEPQRDKEVRVQNDLWFHRTDQGTAAWREKYGDRDVGELWRIAEQGDDLDIYAVSEEVASAVVAEWLQGHPGAVIEERSTMKPAPFELSDGTRIEPGVLVRFRRLALDAAGRDQGVV